MILTEIFEPTPHGYRTEKDDNSVMRPNTMRRTKLTLKRLSKLRMVNDVRKLEHEKYLDKISKQYKLPAATGGLGI
jgi:hypothetical protein